MRFSLYLYLVERKKNTNLMVLAWKEQHRTQNNTNTNRKMSISGRHDWLNSKKERTAYQFFVIYQLNWDGISFSTYVKKKSFFSKKKANDLISNKKHRLNNFRDCYASTPAPHTFAHTRATMRNSKRTFIK